MKHIIVGTAGHIDHGKTTLIKALTGKNTDRLKEEKDRGISIELGFTYFDLKNGKRIGIVDVPGHERFIKNMLAGISGIDLVLLVVAADEGVMPQTKEHLNILSMLQIKKGIIVLTKTDLVEEEWLEMVYEEVREDVKGTFLEEAKIIPVSSKTKEGMETLIEEIDTLTEEIEPKDTHLSPRLPVDRVFSLAGFGTIVTGTLISGTLEEGNRIMVYPKKKEYRIRSIQVHDNKVAHGEAGQRVAINIPGVKPGEIDRGDVIALPDTMEPTMMFDAKLKLLQTAERNINNRDRLRIYHGSAEVFGRVVLLDREELEIGEETFVQIRLEEEIACQKDDPFVIRFYSPMITIGGGIILDPNPPKRKRFREEVIKELEIKEKGSEEEIIEQYLLNTASYPSMETITKAAGNLSIDKCKTILYELEERNIIKAFNTKDEAFYTHASHLDKLINKIKIILSDFHKKNPLKPGMSKEELKSRTMKDIRQKVQEDIFAYLEKEKSIKLENQYVSLHEFEVEFNEEQNNIRNSILKIYENNKFNPPRYEEVSEQLKYPRKTISQVYDAMIDSGDLIKVDKDTVFLKTAYQEAKNILIEYISKHESIQLSEFRDLLGTSRKYSMALLDYFDQMKVTKRIEDKRILY